MVKLRNPFDHKISSKHVTRQPVWRTSVVSLSARIILYIYIQVWLGIHQFNDNLIYWWIVKLSSVATRREKISLINQTTLLLNTHRLQTIIPLHLFLFITPCVCVEGGQCWIDFSIHKVLAHRPRATPPFLTPSRAGVLEDHHICTTKRRRRID